ncbi:MAG: SLBB domain-containing protein [candidate division Zixibacteria bacterium]|nr:SLBB domain-containing protein [candidate division Zixibacteria bacterium]
MPIRPRPFDEPINPERYLIRPGEQFEVVFVNTSLPNLILTVTSEGQVVNSDIGVVDLSGMTLKQAREVLTVALKSLFKADQIVISVSSIYPVPIQVSGMVNRPGTYYGYTSQHVNEIIDSAGGIALGGSSRRIAFQGGPKEIPVDLDVSLYGVNRPRTNSFLYAGRRVVVPEIPEAPVTVGGQVAQPRAIELLPGENLDDLVMLAGGVRVDAAPDQAYAVNDPGRNIHEPGGIRPGDQILVPSSKPASERDEIVIAGAVNQSGRRMAMSAGMTVAASIEAAGGYLPTANFNRVTVFRLATEEEPSARTNRRYPLWVASDKITGVTLQVGDSVHVPLMLGYVEVTGEVVRPGLYPLVESSTAEDYVTMAGGYVTEKSAIALELFDRVSGITRTVSARAQMLDGDRLTVKSTGSEP